jgi:threonine/homoserine/homoserine lactone efflux protein
MSIEFLVTSMIVVATPGTGVLYTMAAGFARGARASIVAAFGCTLGIIPHMLAAITGAAALLHTSVRARFAPSPRYTDPAVRLRFRRRVVRVTGARIMTT